MCFTFSRCFNTKAGFFLELNKRTGKYAQQIKMLSHLNKKINSSTDTEHAKVIVYEIEHTLVGEVIDW